MANFEAERSIIARQLRTRLHTLWGLIFQERQPIADVSALVTGKDLGPAPIPSEGYQPFPIPGRWGGFDQTTWFRLTGTIPASMAGRRVVALARPGGESLIYRNGAPLHGLDNNRDMIILTEKAKAGERFELFLESVPSVRFDEHHQFAYADIAAMDTLAWDAFWDFRAAGEAWRSLAETDTLRLRMLDVLEQSVKRIRLNAVEKEFHKSLTEARAMLHEGLKAFPSRPGDGHITLTGHSHIDTAWLWPIRETERKCGRTFSSVLNLMEQYPEYHFSCSQPAQYEYLKRYYPEQYAKVRERVKEGRWEPCGCFWVEPDLNIPSGEALVRQTVYGNRFFRKEFGIHSRVAWTPDTFGYCYALPQILKRAQVDFFVSTKLFWNSFTQMPYSHFMWEGTDGTQVRAVLPYVNYNGDITPQQLNEQWRKNMQRDRCDDFPFSFGWGDGGGGPTREMLEMGKRYRNLLGTPQCEFGTVMDCLDRMAGQVGEGELPVWNGELYFELHRGCQTTQARTKRGNRKGELALRDAEIANVLAMLEGASYPQASLYECWKVLLTNQFHDILPGSSINEVYHRTDDEYRALISRATCMRDAAYELIMSRMNTNGDGLPIVVFNTLSWLRDDLAVVKGKLPAEPCHVVNQRGEVVLSQRTSPQELLVLINEAPPMGYITCRLMPGEMEVDAVQPLTASAKGMENEFLRVRFDKNGCISSVYDKVEEREVIPEGARANVLQLFEDRPCDWEAWEVDFNFDENMWTPGAPVSVEVVEKGPLRAIVRFVWKTGKSAITQDVTLTAFGQRIDFVTSVDWHEKQTLLKAAFPVDIRARHATFEVQFGVIERPTHNNRDSDRAQFEVPAQRWADLSEGDYGVSLLNDCKYGYDVKGNVLRVSLLRSPQDPDPKADEGLHSFTYSLYPHAWDWRGGVIDAAMELNSPLVARLTRNHDGVLSPVAAFADVDSDSVFIDTIKKAEDSDAVIIRVYEGCGQRADVHLTLARAPKTAFECDLMEENDVPVKVEGCSIGFRIKPHEIRTFKVTF